MKSIRFVILAICLILSGCIGVDIVHPETKEVVESPSDLNANLEVSEIKELDGYQWAGVVVTPVIPVPIPLVIPVGKKKKTIFTTEDKRVVKYELADTKDHGFACAWIPVYCETGLTWGHLLFDPPFIR